MRFLYAAACLVLAVSALPMVASAQDGAEADWATCRNIEAPQAAVTACSQLIERGDLTQEALALAHDRRMSARVAARDYTGAMADADRWAQLQPESVAALAARCGTRAMAGRELDAADRFCGEALALSDERALYTVRGLLRLRQNRNAEAWADFNRVVVADGGSSDQPLYGRGVAALRLGRVQDGRADIAAAVMIDPGVGLLFADWGVRPPTPGSASTSAPSTALSATLAGAPAPPPPPTSGPFATITNPDWLSRPIVSLPDSFFSRMEAAGYSSASVTFQCKVLVSGRLSDCTIVSESIPELQLGQAAMASVMRTARLQPRFLNGEPVEGSVRFPVIVRIE